MGSSINFAKEGTITLFIYNVFLFLHGGCSYFFGAFSCWHNLCSLTITRAKCQRVKRVMKSSSSWVILGHKLQPQERNNEKDTIVERGFVRRGMGVNG